MGNDVIISKTKLQSCYKKSTTNTIRSSHPKKSINKLVSSHHPTKWQHINTRIFIFKYILKILNKKEYGGIELVQLHISSSKFIF